VVTVSVPATGVSLDISSFSLNVGESRQLSASVEPENATIQDVTWSSDDSDVATVDQSGTVLAIGGGSTTIRAQTEDGGFEASAAIEAVVPVTGISLDVSIFGLVIGESQQLTATIDPSNATNQDVVWSTDDESIATVDQSGNVTAIAAGNTTVRVQTEDGGFETYADIEATEAIIPGTGVTLDTNTLALNVGNTQQLTATIEPPDATYQQVMWQSSNYGVANVTVAGIVQAVSAGTATITATDVDGIFSDTCEVTVNE
jgi:uncharacterized protein YjdB